METTSVFWAIFFSAGTGTTSHINIYNIDEISQDYGNMVTNETHDLISNDSFRSTLDIVLSQIDYGEIRCEFVLIDHSICSRMIGLQLSFTATMGTFPTHRQYDALLVATTPVAESNENDRTISMMKQDIESDRRKSSGHPGKLKDQDRTTVYSLTLCLVAISLVVALLWMICRLFQRRKKSKLNLDIEDEAEVFL